MCTIDKQVSCDSIQCIVKRRAGPLDHTDRYPARFVTVCPLVMQASRPRLSRLHVRHPRPFARSLLRNASALWLKIDTKPAKRVLMDLPFSSVLCYTTSSNGKYNPCRQKQACAQQASWEHCNPCNTSPRHQKKTKYHPAHSPLPITQEHYSVQSLLMPSECPSVQPKERCSRQRHLFLPKSAY